ncbi:MAG: hypothetical protein HW416_2899, partial [Chloroflexi bacterium]|nr:hypothetical protein [Chloroflexota bacterium]
WPIAPRRVPLARSQLTALDPTTFEIGFSYNLNASGSVAAE